MIDTTSDRNPVRIRLKVIREILMESGVPRDLCTTNALINLSTNLLVEDVGPLGAAKFLQEMSVEILKP